MNRIEEDFAKKSALRAARQPIAVDRAGNAFLDDGARAGYQANQAGALRPDQIAAGEAQKAKVAAERAAAAAPRPIAAPTAPTVPAAAAPTPVSRAGSALRSVGQGVKSIPGAALRTLGAYAAPATAMTSAVGVLQDKVSGADDGDYYKRFGMDYENPTGTGLPAANAMARTGINAAGVVSDVARNIVSPIGQMFGASPLRFPDQGRAAAAQAPVAAPSAIAAGGAGGGGAVPIGGAPAPQTYRTGDGRQGVLPAGIAVAYDDKGRPAFGGNARSVAAAGGPVEMGGAPAESPLRRPNLDQMGSGFNMVSSRDSAINAQFDGLAKQIQALHGSAKFGAKGSLATKMLRLEEARANALGQNQGALIDSQRNQVADLGNKRGQEVDLYGIDNAERSALRRDTAEDARARVKMRQDAQAAAAEGRQKMSEKQVAMADARATELATGPDGKVDPAKKAAAMDAMARNFGGALDGSAETAGQAREQIATAGIGAGLVADLNKGSNNPSSALDTEFGPLVDPTLGQVFDGQSNIGMGDYLRSYVDGNPFVDTGKIRNTKSKRALRERDVDEDERQLINGK